MVVSDAHVLPGFFIPVLTHFLSKATDYFSHMLQHRSEAKKCQEESLLRLGIKLKTTRSRVWHAKHWATWAGQICFKETLNPEVLNQDFFAFVDRVDSRIQLVFNREYISFPTIFFKSSLFPHLQKNPDSNNAKKEGFSKHYVKRRKYYWRVLSPVPQHLLLHCRACTNGWVVVLRFYATLTARVISWRLVMHMCFLAFSHQI